jgi:hypothetical protein
MSLLCRAQIMSSLLVGTNVSFLCVVLLASLLPTLPVRETVAALVIAVNAVTAVVFQGSYANLGRGMFFTCLEGLAVATA